MQVFLEAIFLNHAPLATTGTMAIARNETQSVRLPEWQRDTCSSPECAPAAFVIGRLPSLLTVKARFSSPDLKNTQIQVQAVAPDGDVLGNLNEATVHFDEHGQSEFVAFELRNSNLATVGVSVSNTNWDWQCLDPQTGNLLSFQQTNHRIYSVLQPPTEPWTNTLPWTEVLEVVCDWTRGAQHPDEAATLITERMYLLGETLVTYCRAPTYANGRFDCTAFLALLKLQPGKGQTVNCDDCATVVSTFANILGCDLFQSSMGIDFHTKSILLIGDQTWGDLGFPRHGVAWKGPCTRNETLFDACLMLKSEPKSIGETPKPLLATNLIFEDTRNQSYKFLLLRDGECEPRPKKKLRRPLGKSIVGMTETASDDYLAFLKQFYKFDQWPGYDHLHKRSFASAALSSLINDPAFAGWTVQNIDTEKNEKLLSAVEFMFYRKENEIENLLGVNLYEGNSSANPNELMLQILGSFHQTVPRIADPPIGDLSFGSPGKTLVVFRRGRFVGLVRNKGRASISVTEYAQVVDQFFVRLS